MDLVALVSHLVSSIVTEPDMIAVKQFDDEEDKITIQILVSQKDLGLVIGHKGQTIGAIRTLVRMSARMHHYPNVYLELDAF